MGNHFDILVVSYTIATFVSMFNLWPGNTNWKGRLGTVDLLIKVACFVTDK